MVFKNLGPAVFIGVRDVHNNVSGYFISNSDRS